MLEILEYDKFDICCNDVTLVAGIPTVEIALAIVADLKKTRIDRKKISFDFF
jgi:hypothetical protein